MNKITDENKEQCIDVLNDVFDNFNFDCVKKTIDALNWGWADLKRLDPKDGFKEKIGCFVPTLDEIKEAAAKLMWDCANTPIDCMATGGFRVEKDFTADPWMRLSFEVESWDASASELENEFEDDEQ